MGDPTPQGFGALSGRTGPGEGTAEDEGGAAPQVKAEGHAWDTEGLTGLPDTVLGGLWPPDRVVEGLAVCSKALSQVLRSAAPQVDLRNKGLGPEGAAGVAGLLGVSMVGVQELDMHACRVGEGGAEALAPVIGSMRALKRLQLDQNSLRVGGLEALVGSLPAGLQHLYLGSNSLGPEGAEALAKHMPPTLLSLNLEANFLAAQGARALGPCLPSTLRTLQLSFNNLRADGVAALAQHLPQSLVVLDLGNNEIGPQGVASLAAHLPSGLQRLDLRGNGVTAKGVAALGSNKAIFDLKYLNLESNALREDGAAALGQFLPGLSALTHLDVRNNRLGVEGGQALAPCLPPGLLHLDASFNFPVARHEEMRASLKERISDEARVLV